MFRVRIESLLVGFAINWIVTFAQNCGSDTFLDPYTGDCYPCGLLCAIGDCSSVCPNYVMRTSTSNTITTETSSDKSWNTSQLLFIILSPVLFCFVLAIIVFTICKRYCNGNSNREAMALNSDIEDVSLVI